MSKPGNVWRKVHGVITKKPTNFSWLIDGNLAGSGYPTTQAELDWAKEQGVGAVVTMTEDALSGDWIRGIEYLHVPTPDLTAPSLDHLDEAVEFIHEQIQNGRPVMVHCAAGLGRAGTVLACYFVKHGGDTAEEAIRRIRGMRPGSIQSDVQEIAIGHYQSRVDGSGNL